jgi:hypothetical protein
MAAVGGFFVALMTQSTNRKHSKSTGRAADPPPAYIFEVARALARMLAREDHKRKNTVGKVLPK